MFIFVSDLFLSDYVGGAELTSQSIIDSQRVPVLAARSSQITKKSIEDFKDRHWIFGNFSGLSNELILESCKKLSYSVVEYDYKYCSYRLPEKHAFAKGNCDCEDTTRGKLISVFFEKAKNLWFMSEKQKQRYCDLFPFLDKKTTRVLSSIFSNQVLDYINNSTTI